MNDVLSKANFLAILEQARTGFKPDEEYVADGLLFIIVNDFARYICSVVKSADSKESLLSSISFIEDALISGDQEVKDLVHECLESLISCEPFEKIVGLLGPASTALVGSIRSGR